MNNVRDAMSTSLAVDAGAPSAAAAEGRIAQLLRDHRGAVFSHALRLCGGDAAWADDVVQETFIRAWRQWAQMTEERGSVRAWLLRVSHNLVMDEYRRARRRHGQVPLCSEAEVLLAEPSEHLVLAEVIRDAMQRLPDVQRQALAATYLSDQTARHAAGTLQVPVGTIKSRVFYGLRSLRHLVPPTAP